MHAYATQSNKGLFFGVAIILLWCGNLALLFSQEMTITALPWIIPAVMVQMFLHTGLFITAHDAMHGVLAPQHKRLNDLAGSLCVILYALFSFKSLRREHQQHHAHPGSAQDPDYHDGEHRGFWRWYAHFMMTYVTWQQLLGMALVFNLLHHIVHIPQVNLLVAWVLPSLLSTLQLFYFGTFLPHRQPSGGYDNRHHARSNDFSVFWSFVTCYHFGYHLEHHEYPFVPWWRLPFVRRQLSHKELA